MIICVYVCVCVHIPSSLSVPHPLSFPSITFFFPPPIRLLCLILTFSCLSSSLFLSLLLSPSFDLSLVSFYPSLSIFISLPLYPSVLLSLSFYLAISRQLTCASSSSLFAFFEPVADRWPDDNCQQKGRMELYRSKN